MINIKSIIVGVGLSLALNPIYSLDLFGPSGSPVNEKMMESMETRIDEYVGKSLDSSLNMFNMSDLMSGDMKNFQSDLNTGVNKIVQDSLKFSFDLQKDIMSGVAKDMGGLQDKLAPFIQKTIDDSLNMGDMGDQSSQLFDQKEFQSNLTNYLSETISSSLESGLKSLTQGLTGKKMTGDFFRSSNFIDSFQSFSKQDADYSSKSDHQDEMLDSMGEGLDKSLSSWGEKFGKDMESWGDNFGKQMEDFGDNLGKSIESQMNNMFGDED
ncbi:MAG: hypothetical protein KC646_14145 [Candidatus Cloacimonetes bacterium]|nr:hypothetical protein [Candidatus Cloacimonadota bacterium]